MNCFNTTKNIETFTNLSPLVWQAHVNQYSDDGPNGDLCSTIPMDIDSFVQNLPNLEELEGNQNLMDPNRLIIQNAQQIESALQATQDPRIKILNIQELYSYQQNETVNDARFSDNLMNNNYSTMGESQFKMVNFNHNMPLNVPTNVDILNQILSNKCNQSNGMYNDSFQNYNNFPSESNEQSLKERKGKFPPKMICSVCGNESSGYHYGANTCEACKLFFRRTKKSIRKTGFAECPKKNCMVNSENRANCPQCRFKKCIAAGMSMSRSRFGRRTKPATSNYQPNISESMGQLVKQLNTTIDKRHINLAYLNDLIVDFYSKSIRVLKNVDDSSSQDSDISNVTFTSNSPLSELSSMIPTSPDSFTNEIFLPNSIIILFCVLFDLKRKLVDYHLYSTIFQDYEDFVDFIKSNILLENEFSQMLKIGIFIKVLRILFEIKPTKEDPVDKRISDFMRAEFTFMSANSTDSTSLALLFTQLNHILFKHMSESEIEVFLTKKCF